MRRGSSKNRGPSDKVMLVLIHARVVAFTILFYRKLQKIEIFRKKLAPTGKTDISDIKMSLNSGKSILLRNLPDPIVLWIDSQKRKRNLTQREVVIGAIETVVKEDAPLFEYAARRLREENNTPSRVPFTFIDLFAGIGGFRIGVERAGGRCVFSSEWDRYCQKTYAAWFGETPHGDIRNIQLSDIPDHDLLVAGFPCQPFSIAGVSKKKSLGRAHGFMDVTQGTLFFQIAKIVEAKKTPAILLENVKNLLSHDKGRTWKVIKSTLEDLGYVVFSQIIDGIHYVPQHRERVFIVAFDRKIFDDYPFFSFPSKPAKAQPVLKGIFESKPSDKYTLSNHLWTYLQNYAEKHRKKGNGFGYGLVGHSDTARTLSARYYKDGSEILIKQKGKNPRRLTPREAARIMGFSDDLPIVVSDTQAYKQFGNAVVPKVAEAVARQIVSIFASHFEKNPVSFLKIAHEQKQVTSF